MPMTPRPEAAIFDVDGTLVDVTGIRHHVMQRPKRFDRFHDAAVDCPPTPAAVEVYHQQRDLGRGILVATARKARWSMHTLLWLREHGIDHDELHMRADDDHRPDYEVKAEILARIRRRWNPVLAVDDNPAVIRLWTEHGIPTVTIPGWVIS